jgi:hypothetical protein
MIKNYTTKIAVDKTVGEIEQLLVKFNAQGIYKEYKGQQISALMFFIEKKGQKIPFKIPLQLEKVRSIIERGVKEGKLALRFNQEPLRTEQGSRIVWRIIKDWISSQLSLYEINFADELEIFLPYAYNSLENKTIYQKFTENKEALLSLPDVVE